MKTRLHLLTLLFSFFLIAAVSAQCPTENVTLSSQADVASFVANYPTCTTIPTPLNISGSDISDLSGLQFITKIETDLNISQNPILTSLQGLHNITLVGDDMSITNNGSLSDLTGLDGLQTISEDFAISNNHQLTSLSGLEKLESAGKLYFYNNKITSMTGLENLSQIGTGGLVISINDNLTSLSGLEGLQSISGNLSIGGNAQLSSIQALQNLDPATI
ncbi:MAG TPA: hypothetical protein VKZ54_00060, partial [Membranihabitans sp.]|nr:hypothetical protein [Membranihabitans sp.]